MFVCLKTENKIGSTGATSLSGMLNVNTTLLFLNLSRKHKSSFQTRSFFFFFDYKHEIVLDNAIGDTETIALSESLKINTTLATLNLDC